MKHLLAASALTLLAVASGPSLAQTMADRPAPSPASAYPVAPAPGLYEAFGEKAGIGALMNDFVPRLQADPRIGSAFKNAQPDRLALLLTEQLCQLAGGPCTYRGRDMKATHTGMNLTRADFNALVEVLQTSMDARGIPFTRQNQMLALLAPMVRDVVQTP